MNGRRIKVESGADPYLKLERAGDYYGPTTEFTNGIPAVFFLLPIEGGRHLAHIQSPPHTITEEADGSLTIRASILSKGHEFGEWHGYLTAGVWSKC